MGELIAACIAFVGTHFLLSHPLRKPLVDRVGEGLFLGLYSLVALVTLGWMVWAYRGVAPQLPLWPVGDGLWAIASLLTLRVVHQHQPSAAAVDVDDEQATPA